MQRHVQPAKLVGELARRAPVLENAPKLRLVALVEDDVRRRSHQRPRERPGDLHGDIALTVFQASEKRERRVVVHTAADGAEVELDHARESSTRLAQSLRQPPCPAGGTYPLTAGAPRTPPTPEPTRRPRA